MDWNDIVDIIVLLLYFKDDIVEMLCLCENVLKIFCFLCRYVWAGEDWKT